MTFLPNILWELNLEGNDLMELDQLDSIHFPQLNQTSVAKNQFSCGYLDAKLNGQWAHLKMLKDPLDQKNGNCHPVTLPPIDPIGHDANGPLRKIKDASSDSPNIYKYIVIISGTIIGMVIGASVCIVFRKKFCKCTPHHQYEEPMAIAIAIHPRANQAENIDGVEHIYEEIIERPVTPYDNLQFGFEPMPIEDSLGHYRNKNLI